MALSFARPAQARAPEVLRMALVLGSALALILARPAFPL